MRATKIPAIFATVIGLAGFSLTTGIGPQPETPSPISADEFVRAIALQRSSLIELYFTARMDPNARAAQDRPLLLAASLQQDWDTVRRLLKAGACVDLADETGLTPLMAAATHGNIEMLRTFIPLATNVGATDRSGRTALHYAVAARQEAAVEMLLPQIPGCLAKPCTDGRDLLAMALDSGNERISGAIMERLPPQPNWTSSTRRALDAALHAENKQQVRLLLRKHTAIPTPEGRIVPLLAYALATHDARVFNTLLECGADPNTVLPARAEKDFLGLLPSRTLRSYVEDDKGITVLMIAAALGQVDYLQALLDAGADRNRATGRYKMLPLYLAAETGQWRCTQLLLGSGPAPDQLRIEITLASQQVSLIKGGVAVFSTICSTGREGYSTRVGDYVITDKERSHRSTIYKVEMPYFMRLNCLDFGMHEGVVPDYPASHGCIRLPGEAARMFFAEIPIGTLVTVK
jgi:ankyrin repeat protein